MNWTSALEIAVRGISWIWAYYFCLHSDSLTPRIHLKILKSICQHREYLQQHLSLYFSPYNHLIGELSTLFIIALIFPEFEGANRWRTKSWQMLIRQVDKQFYQDGGIVEQATFYHHFTLGFYFVAALLQRMNKGEVDQRVWNAVKEALEFSMYMTRPDGLIPMIGDIDNARSIYIENPPMWDFRAFLSTGAVLFNRGDMKRMSDGFKEDSLWLLGVEGMKQYHSIEEYNPESDSKPFPKSGYYIMRSGWGRDDHCLCFDCGEIAAGLFQDSTSSAAHGHADILSFELSAFGQPMIIDPGFYTYNGDERWHYYFRQTRAHNTITIDGKSQAKEAGKMSWSNVPEHRLEEWVTNKDFDLVVGSHNGYSPVIHKRSVLFKKGGDSLSGVVSLAVENPLTPEYWVIHDLLEGSGEHLVEGYLHFVPEVKIEEGVPLAIKGKQIVVQRPNGVGLVICLATSTKLAVDIVDTGNIPDGGWIAPGYGSLVRAPILRYQARVKLPCEITVVIYPFKGYPPVG